LGGSRKGETRNEYKILVVKPQGNISLVRSRGMWEVRLKLVLEK